MFPLISCLKFLRLRSLKNFSYLRLDFKVPMSQNFLSFQVKVHIEKGTSAKKFFDLNKTRFFMNFFKREKLPPFWHTTRISLLSVTKKL